MMILQRLYSSKTENATEATASALVPAAGLGYAGRQIGRNISRNIQLNELRNGFDYDKLSELMKKGSKNPRMKKAGRTGMIVGATLGTGLGLAGYALRKKHKKDDSKKK